MAKMLLRGATLLGFLALAHSGEFFCDVATERTDLPGKILLNCIVTGNVTSQTWTLDGQPVPANPSQLANLMLEVPSQYANGYADFMCRVWCKSFRQRASMRLDTVGNPDTEMTIALAISVFMTIVFIGMALIHLGCYCRRHRLRMRAEQENIDDLRPGGRPMVLTVRPLIAPPLAASQAV